jgi:AcrR family transcriptional regulator
MNRPVDHVRRAELLARIVEYALDHGVTSLTLRPAAEAAGTSGRMLIHHFGSRDAMVAEVVLAIEERLAASIAGGAASDPAGVLRHIWTTTAQQPMRPLVRAVFETWGRALVSPDEYGGFLQRIFRPWRDALAAALEAAGEPEPSARSKATLAMAAFNGLQLARLTSAGDDQVDVAFELLCSQVLDVEISP